MATILVVDDSRASRMLIKALLLDLAPGSTVIEASNADEALMCFAQQVPALAILDMNMPGRTGLELAEQINLQYPGSLMAMLTANIQDSTRIDAEKLGLHFFKKPVGEKVIDSILSLLKGA